MYGAFVYLYIGCSCMVSSLPIKSLKRHLNKDPLVINQRRDVMTDVISKFASSGHKQYGKLIGAEPTIDYFNNGASWASYISSPIHSKHYPTVHDKNRVTQLGYDDQYGVNSESTSDNFVHTENYNDEFKTGDNSLSKFISTPVFDDHVTFKTHLGKHNTYPLHSPQSDEVEFHNSRNLFENLKSIMTPLKYPSDIELRPIHINVGVKPIHIVAEDKGNLRSKNRYHVIREHLPKNSELKYRNHPAKKSNNKDFQESEDDHDNDSDGYFKPPTFDFNEDREPFHEDFDDISNEQLHKVLEPNQKPTEFSMKNHNHKFRNPFENPPPPIYEEEKTDWRFEGGRHINRNNGLFEYNKPDFFKHNSKEKVHIDRNQIQNRLNVANQMLSVLPANAIEKLVLFNKKTKDLPVPEIVLSTSLNTE
ncbi:uncharacterized protein LOC105843582 isoform X1 [Hydra vulgaris]|uniref:Uncharacterized protein LOC105843582 isoform X1 n=1 Tax=Hydra vulgaris TaxID=6087 RepID=A0ABM4BD87_HYDVU